MTPAPVVGVLALQGDFDAHARVLRSLGAEVSRLRGGPKALMAMGVLIERLRSDELAARSEFGERFGVLAQPDQRHQVKSTFKSSNV